MRALLLAAGLALWASPSLAAPATDPEAATALSRRQALGYAIAELTNSEALTRVQFDKMLKDTLPKQLGANPDFIELEAAIPGITDKVIDAMAPIIIKHVITRLPALWTRVGALYANGLTQRELEQVLAFYQSPVGRRLMDAMGKKMDYSRAVRQGIQDPKTPLTADDIQSAQQIGVLGLQQELTAADLVEIKRFESLPVGPKLGALALRFQEVTAAWGNEPSPEVDAAVQEAVMAAMKPELEKLAPK
jgi:hypothetical protein